MKKRVVFIVCLLILANCSKNSNSGGGQFGLNVADIQITEGDEGFTDAVFTIQLTQALNSTVAFDYTLSEGSATFDDFQDQSGTVTFDAGDKIKMVTVKIVGDNKSEANEQFSLNLTPKSNDFITDSYSATATIIEDIDRPVNSTTGMSFSKLDSNGLPIANQSAGYVEEPWECARDENTRILWEIKSADGGLRDLNHTYTWYNDDSSMNAGVAGTENGGSCGGGIQCDTKAYIDAVNAQTLCGLSQWRLPTASEMVSLTDYAATPLLVDAAIFPNTAAGRYLTANTQIGIGEGSIFTMNTESGRFFGDSSYDKTFPLSIRLVHDPVNP